MHIDLIFNSHWCLKVTLSACFHCQKRFFIATSGQENHPHPFQIKAGLSDKRFKINLNEPAANQESFDDSQNSHYARIFSKRSQDFSLIFSIYSYHKCS